MTAGSEPVKATAANHGTAVVLTTRAGTHSFAPRDRLWVSGVSRPVAEVRPGDLVAFLGRVLAVRLVTEMPVADVRDGGVQMQLPSIAA
jgi:hypothetical protein